MDFGVSKDEHEFERVVGLTPTSVHRLVRLRQQVFIEYGSGSTNGLRDEGYRAVGGDISFSVEDIHGRLDDKTQNSRLHEKEYNLRWLEHSRSYTHDGCSSLLVKSVQEMATDYISPQEKIRPELDTYARENWFVQRRFIPWW